MGWVLKDFTDVCWLDTSRGRAWRERGRPKGTQRPKQGKLLWREQGEESALESQIGCFEGWLGPLCLLEVVEQLVGLGCWAWK